MLIDDGGYYIFFKLFVFCIEWYLWIFIFYYYCYYCGIFEMKKRIVDKVEVKSYNILIFFKNLQMLIKIKFNIFFIIKMCELNVIWVFIKIGF